MRKEGFMKKGMAASLVGALALSAVALYGGNAWAADPIDLTKTCSLTIEVESGSQFEADLDQMTIPVDLYKVADVDVSGSYTELTGFQFLADAVHTSLANPYEIKKTRRRRDTSYPHRRLIVCLQTQNETSKDHLRSGSSNAVKRR